MKAVLITLLLGIYLVIPFAKAAETSKSEIEKATAKWAETWNKRDAEALANLYTRDAILLPANSKTASGRGEIKTYWESNFRNHPSGTLTMESVEIEVMGDSAIQISTFSDLQDGKVAGSGKGLTQWKREDGEWKMHRDTWNDDKATSSLPAGKLSAELQHLAGDIGTWDVSFTDDQGNIKKGYFVMEVDPSGKSVTGYWKDLWGPNGYGRNIWYFDPLTQRTMSFGIGPDGGIGGNQYPRKGQAIGEELICIFQGVTEDDQPMAGWDHIKRIDKDTMEYWTTDFVIGGKKIPDSPKMLFKRRK